MPFKNLSKKLAKFNGIGGIVHKENRMGWWTFHVSPSKKVKCKDNTLKMRIVIHTMTKKLDMKIGEKVKVEFDLFNLHIPVHEISKGTPKGDWYEFVVTVKGRFKGELSD